jgi:hypothetical protein
MPQALLACRFKKSASLACHRHNDSFPIQATWPYEF